MERRATVAGSWLDAARRQGAADAMAHDAGGGGLEQGWADGFGDAGPAGLSRLFPTSEARRSIEFAGAATRVQWREFFRGGSSACQSEKVSWAHPIERRDCGQEWSKKIVRDRLGR